ncbi:MAG: ISL3 family transposase [Terriglobales bacterium]
MEAVWHVEKDDHGWVLNASAGPEGANCPGCGLLSTARHSSYLRHLRDLPLQGRVLNLTVRVGRRRCRNPGCKRRIFCQRLNGVTHKHARETKRFGEVIQVIAYALGGRAGERLSRRLGFPVSNDTLLDHVKRAAQFRTPCLPIPVVGVDEWAWRKGYSGYGTILVDLERGVVADLLPDRSAASFEKWLQEHPGVKIISRDRDGVYAEGGSCGAPRAQQVADRFHLVQNLIKAVQDELTHQRHHLLIPTQELIHKDANYEAPGTGPVMVPWPQRGQRPSPRQKEIRQQRRQQKVELFRMVKGLHAQGMRAFEIVKASSISRGRVDKWLRLADCPPQNRMAPRPGMAESFREELRRLWERGCQNGRDLLVEIRKLGYIGSYSGLTRLLSEWREEKRAAQRKAVVSAWQGTEQTRSALSAMRHVSPQEAAALLSKPKPTLSERQSKIVEFLKRIPDFATMRHLVLSFRSILCGGKVSSLKRWIKKAQAAGIEAITKFVRQLKRDQAAVENAVEQVWSNGPVEGHINRLKTVKRQMYGRAGFELLRSRILPLAA